MPAKGIHHVDLAVADVARSLSFYLGLLGPLGWVEEVRYPTYRGTEEVVYLKDPTTGARLGLRPADGGAHRYYGPLTLGRGGTLGRPDPVGGSHPGPPQALSGHQPADARSPREPTGWELARLRQLIVGLRTLIDRA